MPLPLPAAVLVPGIELVALITDMGVMGGVDKGKALEDVDAVTAGTVPIIGVGEFASNVWLCT